MGVNDLLSTENILSTEDLILLVKDLEEIAQAAGQIAMKSYGRVVDLSKDAQGYDNPIMLNEKNSLTAVDIEVQKFIAKSLLEKYSMFGIIAEEEDPEIIELEKRFSHRKELITGRYTFIIDPIDGTTNFLNTNPANHGKKGNPANKDFFGIMINVAHGNEMVAGVIYYPALKKILSTYKGGPTLIDGKSVKLKERIFSPKNPVRISSTFDLRLLGLIQEQMIEKFPTRVAFGSSCYTLYALLTGDIDTYFFSNVELLDFGCTELAYKNAGGLLNGKDSEIQASSMIIKEKTFKIKGLGILVPNKRYYEEMMAYLKKP